MANPFGGQSQISRRRLDLNQNGINNNNRTGGNVTAPKSEISYSIRANNTFEDGMFGPDAAFNAVGQKMGISYNPAIFEHQKYDQANGKLSPIKLNGLSAELIAKDVRTRAITVKVRYDDTDIMQNTRWSGELQVLKNFDLAAGASEVHVTNNAQLVINKSGTNNRHTQTAANDFINPTTLTCANGSLFALDNFATVKLEGAKTSFQVNSGAELRTGTTSEVDVRAGTLLEIKSGGTLTMASSSGIIVEAGGTLLIRSGAIIQGPGDIQVRDGGYICIESGARLDTSPYMTLNVAPNAVLGANPALGLGMLSCNSQLQFCGPMQGGNAELSSICPTGNEALLFDGVDDVVTIAPDPGNANSPIHNIGTSFTIEASIRSDASGGPNQTVFSNREYDSAYGTRGLLFTLYAGRYLLLQMEGQNYYDFNDPSMQIAPNTGCHQVAVSRDNSNTVHFYIDGQAAAYAPVVLASPYSEAAVRIGGDAPYSAQVFKGQIGEVRFWDIARNARDVSRFLSSTLATPQTGLMGYYDFRDASGQTVKDKALVYLPGYNYAIPNGYLGTSTTADAADPAWVKASRLTCNIGGNFRQLSGGKNAQDSTFQTTKKLLNGANAISELAIFPNPASGEARMHFQLREAGKVAVSIQDVTGYTRATALPTTMLTAGAHDVKLPLHALLPGIYLVIVNSPDGRTVVRLEVK